MLCSAGASVLRSRSECASHHASIVQVKGYADDRIGDPMPIESADPAAAATVKVSSCPQKYWTLPMFVWRSVSLEAARITQKVLNLDVTHPLRSLRCYSFLFSSVLGLCCPIDREEG